MKEKRQNIHIFSQTLLSWYKLNARDLPWRNTQDPYCIWISEIILQQTRVAQGYAYYQRFMERFPDVFSLAEAHEDEVMKFWEGLGYYSRARNLHEAAKHIALRGTFPTEYAEVLALKGVGAYTAAAICSFAYKQPYAVVDGNVYRVLARYEGIDTPIDSTEGKKLFTALAQSFMDEARPDVYNQAIMDFGALQCVPASPDCSVCPLAETCVALRTGRVDLLPVKEKKTAVSTRYFTYLYVCTPKNIFIRKRTEKDIWKNLYEVPCIETERKLTFAELELHPQFSHLFHGATIERVELLRENVKHVLSHQRIWADFYRIELKDEALLPSDFRCIDADKWMDYAFPRLLTQVLFGQN